MNGELADRPRFRILGPTEVWYGQRWQGIGDPEWRSLLSCLLLQHGELVSLESLVAALWGDEPPGMASNLISIYMHRLRQLIGDAHGQVLVHQASGYQLCVGLGDLDLLRFEALIEGARIDLTAGNPGTASVLLAEAMRLWRGPALDDVRPTAFFAAQAGRLAELRMTATALKVEADLACSRAAQIAMRLRTVPDSPGFDLCPDPLIAQTPADLLAALSRFRIWAGEPSFQDMQRLSEPRTAASTMCTALSNGSLPSQRVVRAIITGCGGTEEQLQAFITAWRRIRLHSDQPGAPQESPAEQDLHPVP